MENLTVNNIVTQSILNFNFNIFITLFLYSGAVAIGVLFVKEVVFYFIRHFLTSRYDRRAEEIKDLNRKTHDRLVEIILMVDSYKMALEDYVKVRKRLLYSSSRLKKYDKTISENINSLLNLLLFDNGEVKVVDMVQLKKLIEQIREKIDKLWVKKS